MQQYISYEMSIVLACKYKFILMELCFDVSDWLLFVVQELTMKSQGNFQLTFLSTLYLST